MRIAEIGPPAVPEVKLVAVPGPPAAHPLTPAAVPIVNSDKLSFYHFYQQSRGIFLKERTSFQAGQEQVRVQVQL